MAYAAPWEIFGSYPQFIASTPRAKVLKHWDEHGNPTTERGKMNAVHQELYRAAILRAEEKRGLRLENNTYLLSAALQDTKRQAMGNALNCFEKGTVAYCHNMTDEFSLNLRENVEPARSREAMPRVLPTVRLWFALRLSKKRTQQPLAAIVNDPQTPVKTPAKLPSVKAKPCAAPSTGVKENVSTRGD
jgi:hypothetical protein